MKITDSIKKKISRTVSTIVNSVAQSGTEKVFTKDSLEEMKKLCRSAGAQGMVLLKNEKNTLPFSAENRVSVFGRVQRDCFYVGYGSGGDVNAPYKVSFIDALRQDERIKINEHLADIYEEWCENNPVDNGFWGHWPMNYDEMPLSRDLVCACAKESDAPLVIIGRAAGEDRENTLTKGSYYLTNEEIDMLFTVSEYFEKIAVVLDCGSIMDMSWVEMFGDKITAILYAWQNGMESGNCLADVLSGRVSPCGKLSDTIAKCYEDYPSSKSFGNKKFNEYNEDIFVGYRFFETFAKSSVLYPFGFGLSYTDFDLKVTACRIVDGVVKIWVNVKNVGETYSGKQVVQIYVRAPQGKLSKSERSLAAFEKTKLLFPGEEEKLCLHFKIDDCASYDDSGITGFKSAYVLEKGDYEIYVGADVRSAEMCRSFNIPSIKVVKQCVQALAPDPKHPFERLVAKKTKDGIFKPMTERAPVMRASLKDRITANLPADLPCTGDKGYKLADVKSGLIRLEEFTAQLSFEELEAITRGDYTMNSPLGAKGNAGAIGGVLPSLREKGIPAVITTDGPSGIRLSESCSLLPNGVSLACTFDKALVSELYAELAKEMKDRGSDILLAPGMNIHRNPLCGRNFEYFSEDPFLSGKIAASVVNGLQSQGVSACPKHFACNNQETNRTHNDSRVSERALREIYLKGFEICIKESHPKNIMTSYNKINGVWSHYNYDLCTTVLRGEWAYGGNVMTDWWMRSDESHEFKGIVDQGYRIRAQVDVLMPGGARTGKRKPDGTLLKSHKSADGVTYGEMQRCAMNVLKMAMNKL